MDIEWRALFSNKYSVAAGEKLIFTWLSNWDKSTIGEFRFSSGCHQSDGYRDHPSQSVGRILQERPHHPPAPGWRHRTFCHSVYLLVCGTFNCSKFALEKGIQSNHTNPKTKHTCWGCHWSLVLCVGKAWTAFGPRLGIHQGRLLGLLSWAAVVHIF